MRVKMSKNTLTQIWINRGIITSTRSYEYYILHIRVCHIYDILGTYVPSIANQAGLAFWKTNGSRFLIDKIISDFYKIFCTIFFAFHKAFRQFPSNAKL